MSSRRDFLAACGALALGRLGGGPAGAPGVPAGLPGLQLFTMRHELDRDFEGTLARIAEMGYREVDLVSTFGRRGADVRRILDRLALSAVSQHIAPDAIEVGDFGDALLAALVMSAIAVILEVFLGVDDDDTYTLRVTRRIAQPSENRSRVSPEIGGGTLRKADS